MSAPPRGTLHLAPVTLGGGAPASVLAPATCAALAALDYFIVENEKSARRFLKDLPHPRPLRELSFARFDKDGTPAAAAALLAPLLGGRSAAVLSEAGCPAIADPGARLVDAAHRAGLRVVPHVGPSALLLALMAAGFNGQRFAFHGYLPVEGGARRVALDALEQESRQRDMTQLFIETPYRNDALLADLLACCAAQTRLCVAADLTLPTESVVSRSVAEWRAARTAIGRRPALFVLYAR